ncbi:Mu-like prophage I protein [Labilithrix luteola]|uniref:Mu-like prophage I protein n=1 Tax=Labilithrix luteola TaxID=1391654 RepID=A0A0K1Q750_9BACT|nr:phage protease [Labilithrix luteola]AKV01661.1 Mu-like prophage I protein [Labilithrix luteola]
MNCTTHVLSLETSEGSGLPTEFRIFGRGKNETTKGTFVFDNAAAASVMAEYEAHGIDLAIDYDHASLSSGQSLDPAQAGKAAGWFNLELRNGELWAVNVRWTEPAAEALRRKEWRFYSPAFQTKGGRITTLLNVAITNLPATRRLEPLMAAGRGTTMATGIPGAVDADAENTLRKIAKLLGLEDPTDPDAIRAAFSALFADGGDADANADDGAPDEIAATHARLMRLTGRDSTEGALAEVGTWRASHLRLEQETQRLAKELDALESAERRRLCVELVMKAGRAPATIWANPLKKNFVPKSYLATMPIVELRNYVKDAINALPPAVRRSLERGSPTPELNPPAGDVGEIVTHHGTVSLSEREIERCKAEGVDVTVYAKNKAIHLAARGAGG